MKYLQHDLDVRDNDKIYELIEAHGMQGYGLWWVILEELYKAEEKGFQIQATDTWFKRMARQNGITDWRTLIRTLDTMSDLGLIDSQMWADHIIYCQGILERADAYTHKKELARLRKQAQRERDRQIREEMSRVTDAGQTQCHDAVTTNTRQDKTIQLNSIQFKSESEKETASQSEAPPKDDPPKNACDRILEKLLPLTEDYIPPIYRHDWHLTGLLPWRDRLRQVREDFGLFVGRQISFKRDQETQHPLRKGVAHIEKLEETTSGVRKLIGYWRDFEAIAAEQEPRREIRALPLEFDREKAERAARGLPL